MTTAATSAASSAAITAAQVTDAQLARYATLVYSRTGIRIAPQKKTLLSNRLRRRLRETGLADYDAYYNLLIRLKSTDAEWDAFLQEITTHETYLFRDESHWNWFRQTFLAERIAAASQNAAKRTLRVWSCAASTGDEAYTIAACIAAAIKAPDTWKIKVFGTDIGVGALEQARAAVFGERSMKLVPSDIAKQFFSKAADANLWTPKPVLTKMVEFKQHNLMDPLREAPFDVAILKNVLIYFDAESKSKVMQNIRSAILPGGYLLAGSAEGISEFTKGLERLQSWLFRLPTGQEAVK